MTISLTRHVFIVTGLFIAGVISFFAFATGVYAQPDTAGRATGFSSVEYYDPPHQQQVKSRLSGAEAQPQPGGLLLIKHLKLETFGVDGKPEIVVNAPECLYDTVNGVARSPGRLQARTGEGKVRIAGEGFLWRQNDSSLTISNHVQTVIEQPMK
ncbi:MAG: hypothetical protein KGJ60_01035 [Verrucomicrobiota bacterium]|nr:hypothetical protein [Verrucomicrobiota bacterium]